MTNENTATATDTSNEAAPAKKAYFFQRFGKMTRVDIRRGRKGEFARIEIDCGKFTETAYAFNASVVEKIKAAGEGAEIWMKGPKEPMQRKNEQGGTYSEEVLKVIYFKDKSAEAAPEAAAEEAPVAEVPAEPQDLTAIKGIGEKVAEKLTEAGVTTYAQLNAMSGEELDAISAGMGARASKGDWQMQAGTLAEEARMRELEAEAPF
jgi:predicted flap endonuclease-1-like 5' DNA nuclease